MMGMPKLAPSRINKKQIMAHLGPDLVEAAHRRCEKDGITIQELIGHAVNSAVAEYGRKPFLNAGRERLMRRIKAVAKVQNQARGVRNGKRRIGAWFNREDVEKVKDMALEFGIKVEALVDMGLNILLEKELKNLRAEQKIETPEEQRIETPEKAEDWDWSTADAAPAGDKIPKKPRSRKAA